MKTDLYTKVVLTIIAVCLTINLLKDFNFIQNAHAEPAPRALTDIAADPPNDVIKVDFVKINGVDFN